MSVSKQRIPVVVVPERATERQAGSAGVLEHLAPR
jgi:hypothetical protein